MDEPVSRRRRRFPIVVIIVAVGAFLVSFFLVASYDPLEPGSSAILPRGTADKPSDSSMRYRDGATGSFAFSIRNGGRWGVTIMDLPILHDEPFYSLFDVTRAEVSDAPGTVGPYTLFTPFSLPPGEERLIRLSGTFTDCEWHSPGSSSGFAWINVRYRFLGLTDIAEVALPFEVQVVSPPDVACPRPRPSPDRPSPSPAGTASG